MYVCGICVCLSILSISALCEINYTLVVMRLLQNHIELCTVLN